MCFSFLFPCCQDPNRLIDSDLGEEKFASPKSTEMEKREAVDKKITVEGRNRLETTVATPEQGSRGSSSVGFSNNFTIPVSMKDMNRMDGLPSSFLRKKELAAPPSSPVGSSDEVRLAQISSRKIENLNLLHAISHHSFKSSSAITEEVGEVLRGVAMEASLNGEIEGWVDVSQE
ncbi:MAG: hypothetical protein ACI9S8_000828 [Chlamydiales bacterium]|jgi:hypothetical protein